MSLNTETGQNHEVDWTDSDDSQPSAEELASEEAEEEDIREFFEQLLEDAEADEDEDDEDEFQDAEQNFPVGMITSDVDGDDTETEEINDAVRSHILDPALSQRARVLRSLARSELGRLFLRTADDDDDTGIIFEMRGRRRKTRPDPNRFPKVPSERGVELMNSGTFGASERNTTAHKKKLARRILDRELGIGNGPSQKLNQNLMVQSMIPSSVSDMIVHYDDPVYSGQFSNDGEFFFACVKDFKVRMYNTSNPYRWRYYKKVEYPFGQWTLTDATLSPDNKYLAYTSIQPKVCLAPTDPNDRGDPYILDLASYGSQRRERFISRHDSFGIWSVRFSGDGRELVAGTSAHTIVVYDIESRRSVLEISGHGEDVNAVCFGDVASPHIIYSGSDDTTLKVWDRRSMGDSREAGAFVGHTEGLTYIDSKGDGRYVLSNGKDQSMKLWDLRMAMSSARLGEIDTSSFSTGFDYRWGAYDEDDWKPHPNDNSLVTFRGHKVLRTLIRCHFSPPGSTNSRYVYSGSEDGKVYIYNLDATLAAKIDVFAATKNSRRTEGPEGFSLAPNMNGTIRSSWRTCVRDASWHPNAPVIAASALNGYEMSSGTVTVHSWNDGAEDDEAEPRMGVSFNDQLKINE